MLLLLIIAGIGKQLLESCCRGKYADTTMASKNLTSLIRSCLPQLSYFKFCLARIQYLPNHEKDQIQDFRNWMQSGSETTTRSAPESPVIGLIENSTANPMNIDMPGTSNEPNLEAPKHTSSAATEGTSNASGPGSSEGEGSRGPAVRVVPFQSMPQSTQEVLGKEFFDDPLLSVDNMKKLADYMQWCFKYTKVIFLLLLLACVE